MEYIVEAFKALEEVDDSVVTITPKEQKQVLEALLDEAVDDYWVLSDGNNPRNSKVFAHIDDLDSFIVELEDNVDGKYWELLHFVNGDMIKVWSTKEGKIVEKCKDESCKECAEKKIDEASVVKLEPEYDSRKSFYGKANVVIKDDGTEILYSYHTPVCAIKDGKATLLRKGYLGWSSSPTTLRHVKEFLKQHGLKSGSVNDLAKMYPVEQSSMFEDLKESITVDTNDKEEVEKALDVLDKDKEEESQKIIDAEAETLDDIKDSYVGDYILTCPTCLKYFMKDPTKVVKDEKSGRFNVNEACPHCGAQEGFIINYQVAKADLNQEEADKELTLDAEAFKKDSEDTSKESNAEETEVKADVEIEKKKPSPIELEDSLDRVEGFNEEGFEKLLNEYLKRLYSNVDSFKVTSGRIIDESCEIEGTIKYTDEHESSIKVILEKTSSSKSSNKCRMSGMCEQLNLKEKSLKFGCNIIDNCLIFESLLYHHVIKKDDEEYLVEGYHKN